MRRLISALALVAALAAAAGASAQTIGPNSTMSGDSPSTCDGKPVKLHIHRYHAIMKRVYEDHFNLPDTDPVPRAQEHKLCVRIANVRDQLGDYRADRKQRWYENVNPYTGGGQRWALPYSVVVCESGAGSGSSNYYGLLQGWDEWNYGLAQTGWAGDAPKLHQDIAAHRGRVLYGGYWECG